MRFELQVSLAFHESHALPHCSFHGLRKAAATRLIDGGCNVVEAAAITGLPA
jgi:hypothetical protein